MARGALAVTLCCLVLCLCVDALRAPARRGAVNENAADEWLDILELTYIAHPPTQWGKTMALITLLPIAVIVSVFTIVVCNVLFGCAITRIRQVRTRDLEALYLLIGLLLNECLNHLLKNQVRQPRPSDSYLGDATYGMPSSHTQLAFFVVGYVTLWLGKDSVHCDGINRSTSTTASSSALAPSTAAVTAKRDSAVAKTKTSDNGHSERRRKQRRSDSDDDGSSDRSNGSSSADVSGSSDDEHRGGRRRVKLAPIPPCDAVKPLACLLTLIVAMAIAYSRVYLGVHSVAQVTVGALVGMFDAALWHVLGECFIRDRFVVWQTWACCRACHLHTMAHVPNIVAFDASMHASVRANTPSSSRADSAPRAVEQ